MESWRKELVSLISRSSLPFRRSQGFSHAATLVRQRCQGVVRQSERLLSSPGIVKPCNFCRKMTYGTIFPSRQMIASLSLARMNVSSSSCSGLRSPFSPTAPRRLQTQRRLPLLVDYRVRLIAPLMAPYSRCLLSSAVPAEAASHLLGPPAPGNVLRLQEPRTACQRRPGAVGRMRDAERVLRQSHAHSWEKVIAHTSKWTDGNCLLEQKRGEHGG